MRSTPFDYYGAKQDTDFYFDFALKEQRMRQSVVYKGGMWTREALETMEKDARGLRAAMDAPESFKPGDKVIYVGVSNEPCIVVSECLASLVASKTPYVREDGRVVVVSLVDGRCLTPTPESLHRSSETCGAISQSKRA